MGGQERRAVCNVSQIAKPWSISILHKARGPSELAAAIFKAAHHIRRRQWHLRLSNGIGTLQASCFTTGRSQVCDTYSHSHKGECRQQTSNVRQLQRQDV